MIFILLIFYSWYENCFVINCSSLKHGKMFMLDTKRKIQAVSTAIFAAILAPSAEAIPLANGSLFVDIRPDNGAIDTLTFGGSDFYNPGAPVSDFGFAGDVSGTNATDGFDSTPIFSVIGGGDSVVVNGSSIGGEIVFSRAYSIVSGFDVLRTTTSLVNTTIDTFDFFFGDFFDPDQGTDLGLGFATKNDIFSLGSIPVGQATTSADSNTVVIGSLQDSLLNFPEPVGFCSFAPPLSGGNDGDGALEDKCVGIGISLILNPGESFQFTFDQAFGTTPEAAQTAFLQANVVPEPGTLSLIGAGLIGAGLMVRRRRSADSPSA